MGHIKAVQCPGLLNLIHAVSNRSWWKGRQNTNERISNYMAQEQQVEIVAEQSKQA